MSTDYAFIGAAIIATHSVFIKILLSLTLRLYQFYLLLTDKHQSDDDDESESKDQQREVRNALKQNKHVTEFEKAQVNESEYAPLMVVLLFYLSLNHSNEDGVEDENSSSSSSSSKSTVLAAGAIMAPATQILYVWTRAVVGYPNFPIVVVAIARYCSLVLLISEVWKLAVNAHY